MMAKVRFKLTLKGNADSAHGAGIPLAQLGHVADEAAKFLRMLSEDLQVDAEEWIAIAPRRGSFAFDVVSAHEVPARQWSQYRARVSRFAKYKPRKSKPIEGVRRETLIQFAKIGTGLAEGQSVEIDSYRDMAKKPERLGAISEALSAQILESLEVTVDYYGSMQGRPHSLNVGAAPAFFNVRDLATGSLVRCEFKPDQYAEVVSLFRRQNAVILVSGYVSASREHKTISRISVERVEECGDITTDEFDSFFGAAPNLTGDLSTEEFVDSVRRDD